MAPLCVVVAKALISLSTFFHFPNLSLFSELKVLSSKVRFDFSREIKRKIHPTHPQMMCLVFVSKAWSNALLEYPTEKGKCRETQLNF